MFKVINKQREVEVFQVVVVDPMFGATEKEKLEESLILFPENPYLCLVSQTRLYTYTRAIYIQLYIALVCGLVCGSLLITEIIKAADEICSVTVELQKFS